MLLLRKLLFRGRIVVASVAPSETKVSEAEVNASFLVLPRVIWDVMNTP